MSSARVRTVRLGRGAVGPAALAVATLVGALVGGGAGVARAGWLEAHTAARKGVDPTRYQLVVPGVKLTGLGLAEVARSGVVDGGLALQTRGFDAPERLVPRVAAVGRLEVTLGARSGPLGIVGTTASGQPGPIATLTPGAAWLPHGAAVPAPASGPWVVRFDGGRAWLGDVDAGAFTGAGVELAPDGAAFIDTLRVVSPSGRTLLDESFDGGTDATARTRWAARGAAFGAAWGAVAATARTAGGWLAAAAAGALALVPLAVPYATWLGWTERMVLVGVDVGTLRRGALAVASIPLGLAALGALGVPARVAGLRLALPRWVAPGVVAVAAALGCRDLSGWGWGLPALGLASAALGWRSARAAGLADVAVVLRDAPAWMCGAALGWELGLLPALAWRAWCVGLDAPALLRRDAAPVGTEALLGALLLVPIGVEAALRAGPLGAAWSPEGLAGASVGGAAEPELRPFWTAACGDAPHARVYALGGSSTGGAWQFRGEPGAFFPAQLHTRLCAAGLAVHSLNLGEGGRDSFDFAQAAPVLFAAAPPKVVIAYLGVNDLLTRDSPLTRKARADLLAGRSAAVGAADAWGARSRLLAGLGLLVRPRDQAASVAAVPLVDAEDNLRAIVAAAGSHGAQVILVPEVTRVAEAASVAPYAALMRRLADELDAASFVDPHDALGTGWEGYLTDRNHLSEAGGAALAAGLEPVVRGVLGQPAPGGEP